MSGRLLSFSQFLGGADNVKVIEMFPSTTKVYSYNFAQDITSWTFGSTYQSLLLDSVTYDRVTGLPNFTETNVLGYWPSYTDPTPTTITDVLNGSVDYRIKADRYTGAIFPNARENVVMTVASFTWNSPNGSATDTDSHRWAIIERYLPGDSTPGDPSLDASYIPYGTGAVVSFTRSYAPGLDDATLDVVYSYTDNGSQPGANGVGLQLNLKWETLGTDPEVSIANPGSGYRNTDTIVIPDTVLGNGGTGTTTITITNAS
jgi:hypothetical protein